MAEIQELKNTLVTRLPPAGSIRTLDDVARELIENSLDAGASAVHLQVLLAQHASVVCKDNGSGVAPYQMRALARPWHTSKLATTDVTTRGFRGRALYTLFASSRGATVISRQGRFRSCFRAEFENGSLDNSPLPCEDGFGGSSGTIVRLVDVGGLEPPTRLLSSALRSLAFSVAVCCPHIRVQMVLRSMTTNQTVDTGLTPPDFAQRVENGLLNVYGVRLVSHTATTLTSGRLQLSAVFAPNTEPPDPDHHYIFVNGRPHTDPGLVTRVQKAVAGHGPSPVFVLSVVYKPTVAELLEESDAVLEAVERLVLDGTEAFLAGTTAQPPAKRQCCPPTAQPDDYLSYSTPYTVLRQVQGRYILVQVGEGPGALHYLVDQHAADERVKLEIALETFVRGALENHEALLAASQLVAEQALGLTGPEQKLLESLSAEFKAWGITFGPGCVRSLPPVLQERMERMGPESIKNRLLLHAADLQEGRKRLLAPRTDWLHAMASLPTCILEEIHSKACSSAVVEPLSVSQCEQLVWQLRRCRFPLRCAQGRPIIVPLLTK